MSDMPGKIERMFEQRGERWVVDIASPPRWLENAGLAGAEHHRSAQELIVSPAEVIARGETEPITAELAAALWDIDPATLDDDVRLGYVVAMDRVANAAHARRGLGVTAFVEVCMESPQIPQAGTASLAVGPALGLGRGSASEVVATAMMMAARLPGARAMALAGDLTWRKASTLASAVVSLTAEQTARVEAKVLGRAWKQPPSRFDAAVRRTVDQVDPDGIDARRKDQRRVIRLVRQHHGDGMGQLFAEMPVEKLDRVYLAADTWARRRKNDGDPRTLDELRVEALVCWADSFLAHGDAATCDRDGHHPIPATTDDDTASDSAGDPDSGPVDTAGADVAPASGAASESASEPTVESGPSVPRRHGRSAVQMLVWDLSSLLGATRHAGLLLDTDTTIGPHTVTEMIAAGLRVRRAVLDPNGHLIDLTPKTWLIPPTDAGSHPAPVELLLTTTATRLAELSLTEKWAFDDLQHTDPHLAKLLTELLEFPLTADTLDDHPGDDEPSAALAAFVAIRAGHPVNPCAGPTPANAADNDHHRSKKQGGQTVRNNLGPLTRHWHRGKTFTGWTVEQKPDGWHWTSPTGRHYLIEPFDYRLGP